MPRIDRSNIDAFKCAAVSRVKTYKASSDEDTQEFGGLLAHTTGVITANVKPEGVVDLCQLDAIFEIGGIVHEYAGMLDDLTQELKIIHRTISPAPAP